MKLHALIRWLSATIVVAAAGVAFSWPGSVIALVAMGAVVGAALYIFTASSLLRAALNVGAVALLLAVLVAVILQ